MSFSRTCCRDLRAKSQGLRRNSRWQACAQTSLCLRTKKIPEHIDFDELDVVCTHFVAFNDDGDIIGTARSYPYDMLTMKVERVAVLKEWRGKGAGAKLMEAAETHARGAGYRNIRLHAQAHAVPFYDSLGYVPTGDSFVEANILHIAMQKRLVD